MAFPSLSDISDFSDLNGSTVGADTTVDIIPNVQENDLICYAVANDGGEQNPALPGYAEVLHLDELTLFAKKATSSEPSSVTIALDSVESVAVIGWRIPASEWSQDTNDIEAMISASNDPPNLTPSYGSEDTTWIAISGVDSGRNVDTYPSGYSNQSHFRTGLVGGDAAVAICSRELAASSEDPGIFDWSSNTSVVSATVAIRPAAAAGGGGTEFPFELAYPTTGVLAGV